MKTRKAELETNPLLRLPFCATCRKRTDRELLRGFGSMCKKCGDTEVDEELEYWEDNYD